MQLQNFKTTEIVFDCITCYITSCSILIQSKQLKRKNKQTRRQLIYDLQLYLQLKSTTDTTSTLKTIEKLHKIA